MPSIKVHQDAYDWFEKERKKYGFTTQSEFLLRMLNWWEYLPTKPKIFRNVDESNYRIKVELKT